MAQVEHDRYVEDLCSKIRPKYDKLFRNVRIYSKHKKPRSLAEIDVIAVKGRTLEAYEVKCSYRKVKAKKQLHRIKRLMPRVKKVFLFCGESGKIESL